MAFAGTPQLAILEKNIGKKHLGVEFDADVARLDQLGLVAGPHEVVVGAAVDVGRGVGLEADHLQAEGVGVLVLLHVGLALHWQRNPVGEVGEPLADNVPDKFEEGEVIDGE